jgi:hypothetical protein
MEQIRKLRKMIAIERLINDGMSKLYLRGMPKSKDSDIMM